MPGRGWPLFALMVATIAMLAVKLVGAARKLTYRANHVTAIQSAKGCADAGLSVLHQGLGADRYLQH